MSFTFLSFGAGQDSTDLLYEICEDPKFRERYNIDLNEFAVIMSPTGNEHRYTYKHIAYVQVYCAARNIPFFHLDYSYHPKGWNKGLIEFYERTTTVGSKVFKKTCTDNLKIKPIYRFLNHHIIEKYDLWDELYATAGPKTKIKVDGTTDPVEKAAAYKKDGIKLYAKKHGKINVIIGIAKGEESRASTNEESKDLWMRLGINKLYPLIELGWDRQICQDRIKMYGHPVPMPSNCILCPFMSMQELLYLYRFEPEWYYKWVELEANKLVKYKHKGDKNCGVWATKTLDAILEKAQEKYGHWTDEQLTEYKMSHGHCVKSRY